MPVRGSRNPRSRSRNRCSRWIGISVQDGPEYATSEEYLKEGTITEFSGISFNPYTYLEGKRVPRLLTQKIRGNANFIKKMRIDKALDPASGRKSITEQRRIWDFIPFLPPKGEGPEVHSKVLHCTVAIGPNVDAEAMITFPNGMRSVLRNNCAVLHSKNLREGWSRPVTI